MALKSWDIKDIESPMIQTAESADRNQCPPDEKVRAFAKGKISGDTTVEEHIQNCQWCAREYRDHARDLEWNRFIGRSTKASYVVILAIIIFEIIRHLSKK